MNLSFAGCGFLGVYHLGVAACLSSHAPQFLKNVTAFAGASAGSLVAAVLATSAPLNKCSDYVIDLTHDARRHPLGPFNPQFDLVGNLRRGLELHLPSNSHRVCSGRLFVSVTSLKDRKNVIISEFDSKEELIQVWKKHFIAPKFLVKSNFQLSVIKQNQTKYLAIGTFHRWRAQSWNVWTCICYEFGTSINIHHFTYQ